MATKKNLRYPWPSDHPIPQFDTKHEAALFTQAYKAEGHIKPCVHLGIGRGYTSVGPYGYRPTCAQDSFQKEPEYRYGHTYSFYGCPEPCLYFRDEREAKREAEQTAKRDRRQAVWQAVRRDVIGVATWFTSLAGTVQVLIVSVVLALALALAGYTWDIVEIVKIVMSGKR